MEKVKKAVIKKYPILRLYKSDLENIFVLFKENYTEIEIVADSFKLEDFSEINNINKQEIVDFKISAHNPYLSVEFSDDSVSVYLSDGDDIKLRGLADKIEEILSARKSSLRFFVSLWMQISSANLLIWLTVWFFPFKEYKLRGITLLISILLFYVLWSVWGYRISTKKHTLIYLYDYSSASSFFKRNKDKIFLVILSAVIGGIITLFISWIMKMI